MSLSVDIMLEKPGFSLSVRFETQGGVTALLGPSGAGKTTLANAVAGLESGARGRIVIDGDVVLDSAAGIVRPSHARAVGYVFQDARLFPHLSVARNIGFGAWFSPRLPIAARGDIVALLGIEGLLDRMPAALSGGEAQRVAIARAILSAPRLLIMDEPLSALDLARRREILPYLERIRDELSLPILYVSHSVPEVARLAAQVVRLRAGRQVDFGSPEEVLGRSGSQTDAPSALLPARVARHDTADGLTELDTAAGPLVVTALDMAAGQTVRVRIAANDVMVSRSRPTDISALNVLPARVDALVPAGPTAVDLQLSAGRARLVARLTRRSVARLDLAPGAACHAIVKSMQVDADDIGRTA